MSLAIDIIKVSEGLRLKAYKDTAGIWTIGHGRAYGVKYGMQITQEQADEFLREDMVWVLELIETTVKVQLNENQHAATASLIFNIGPGAWRSSTVLRRLNTGNYEGAANAFLLWNKITLNGVKARDKGLVNRRERERTLFLLGITTALETASGSGVTGGEAKPMIESKTQWWAGLGLGGVGLTGVLPEILTAFTSIKLVVPEVILTVGPLLLLGAIFIAIMVNRLADSRKGIH